MNFSMEALAAELDRTLAQFPCIHGFITTASVSLSRSGLPEATIVVRCYECRQNATLPPGAEEAVAKVLAKRARMMPMPFDLQPTLAGELLNLRPLSPDDFDGLYAVASDPLLWDQHPAWDRYKIEVFRELFGQSLASGGALVVTDAAGGEIIGSSRYNAYDAERSQIEIGWSFLARRFWGGRYNAEMKRLMLGHAFGFVDTVIFLVGPDNMRSQKALAKIGAEFVRSRLDASGKPCVEFRILRSACAD